MKWFTIVRHRAGTTFVLIFFSVFVLLSGLLVANAIEVYQGIDARADATHNRSIALMHLSGAARRADIPPSIAVLEDGTTALAVREDGKDYYYLCREGYLYRQQANAKALRADRLCPAGSLLLKEVAGTIRADYLAPDGGRSTLLLYANALGATT